MARTLLYLLLTGLVSISSASAETDRCDTPLTKAFEDLRALSQKDEEEDFDLERLISTILTAAHPGYDKFDADQWKDFRNHTVYRLDDLKKWKCIPDFPARYVMAALQLITKQDEGTYSFDDRLAKFPSLSLYWKNQAFYAEMRAAAHPDQNPELDQSVREKLRKEFFRKVKGLGRVSVEDLVLASYDATQINTLSAMLRETVDILGSSSGKVMLTNRSLEAPISIDLTPSDIARFAINHLDRKIEEKSYSKLMTGVSLQYGDILISGALTGDVDFVALNALLDTKNLKEFHESVLKQVGRTTWTIGKVFLNNIPITMPFVTLGTVVVEAIQRKKEYEKTLSERSQLIHR